MHMRCSIMGKSTELLCLVDGFYQQLELRLKQSLLVSNWTSSSRYCEAGCPAPHAFSTRRARGSGCRP